MQSNLKKLFIIQTILIFSIIKLFGQNYNIDYYGVVSTEIDSNMSKMTSDLYFTQLSEINNFNVTDKRLNELLSEKPDESTFSDDALSFYTLIEKEKDSDQWIATLYVINKNKNEQHSKQKKYDSFYKILMESKSALKENLKQLIESDADVTVLKTEKTVSFSSQSNTNISSTEILSGTWTGEENIDKIVILRGGRGFVIFKNGASMNITVELDSNNSVIITQKGRSNASFYPELPRNTALNAALSAPPIKWTLKLSGENILTGTKETLFPDGDNYKTGSIQIKWVKVN